MVAPPTLYPFCFINRGIKVYSHVLRGAGSNCGAESYCPAVVESQ